MSAKHTRRMAAVLTFVLLATFVNAVATPAGAAVTRLKPQHYDTVPGGDATTTPHANDPAARAAQAQRPAPVWPAAGESVVNLAAPGGAAAKAGALPVRVAAAGDKAAAATRAKVQLLAHGTAPRKDRPELLLRVGRADGGKQDAPVTLTVDYSGFRTAAGGDFGNRLRVVALPECALSTPDKEGCAGTPLATANDGTTVTATVPAAAATPGTLLAVQAGPAGSTGDFTATALATSGKWQAGTSSGDFSWSYPMRVPPGINGPEPQVGLGYSAQSVDGRTAASNNQPSWVGEGFNLGAGSIEREYRSCGDDMEPDAQGRKPNNTTATGDLCWVTDNATMSLNGRSVELIRDDASGAFRPRDEDGSSIERIADTGNGDADGEYWKVTTTDGTQYWFGLNRLPGWTAGRPETNSTWTVPVFGNHPGEYCHADTFAASSCAQAWRWNLDYVVDTHGNSMSYWYVRETAKYARNGTASAPAAYDRSGWLDHIDYGTRTEAEFGRAPMQVSFSTADRCLANCATHTAATWPDSPWDLDCPGSTCQVGNPTFWTTRRLAGVTTRVVKDGAYTDVESWTLTHSFPSPGDNTRAGLWLASIGHAGLAGGARLDLPQVTFTGVQLDNRVDSQGDQLPAMKWWRVASIRNESGGEVSVAYEQPECKPGEARTPETNTQRCFPTLWTPPGQSAPKLDWFHKYVVRQVVEADHTGGNTRDVIAYEYLGGGAWHFADDDGLTPEKYKTWSQWRGYGTVRTRAGDAGEQTLTEARYFRGMNGDKLPGGTRSASVKDFTDAIWTDDDALAGLVREQIVYNGTDDKPVSSVITDPWQSAPTATRSAAGRTATARYTDTGTVRQRVTLDGGREPRVISKSSTFDKYGRVTNVDDRGDEAVTTDDRCTITTYAPDGGTGLRTAVQRTQTYALSCAKTPAAGDVLADTVVAFDGGEPGAPPTKGDVSRLRSIAGGSPAQPQYVDAARNEYDQYGRIVRSWDAKGNVTTRSYTPATGAAPTSMTSTDAKGFHTVTELRPEWGLDAATVDPNDNRTDLGYDPLGRLTGVWLPGRDRGGRANVEYQYQIGTSGSSVATSRLTANGGYVTSYVLYDGLLRPRQTQAPAPGGEGGRNITDTIYDSVGRAFKTNAPYVAEGEAGTTLFIPASDKAVPAQTVTAFDGAGRAIAETFKAKDVPKWSTLTYYAGDRVDVTPPTGGTATSTLIDGRERVSQLRQYRAAQPSGEFDATTYTYRGVDQIAAVTDPAGNTWSWEYDVRGRNVRSVDPDRGATTYAYDDADELTSTTDSRGRTVAFTYDELGRRTGAFDRSSTPEIPLASWTYDTVPGGKGRPATSTRWIGADAYGSQITGYTATYQTTGTRITIPAVEGGLAGTYEFGQTYKADGSPSTLTLPGKADLPNAEVIGYGYDAFNQPTTVTGQTSYVAGTAYTRLGETGVITLSHKGANAGPFVEIGFTYDESTRRLARQEVIAENVPGTVADVSFDYDQAGNVTRTADAATGDTQCFRYDPLRRLTDAWTPTSGDCKPAPSLALSGPAPYWQSWTHDKTGNRLTQVDHRTAGDVTTEYTYPATGAAQPHAVTGRTVKSGGQSVTTAYTYDQAGNTLTRASASGDAQALTWDSEGNLARVTEDGATTSFVYTPNGDRLIRRDATGSTLYLPGMEVRSDRTSGQVSTTRYYALQDRTLAQRTAAGLTWLVPDRQGTAQVAVSADDQRVTRRRDNPFGEPRGAVPPWPNQHGFLGGVEDPTGLVYLGAREYDPGIGRFVSVDPLLDPANPQQLNGYAYANNSPVTYSDADGKMPCGPDGEPCGYGVVPPVVQQWTAVAAAVRNVVNVARRAIVRTATQTTYKHGTVLTKVITIDNTELYFINGDSEHPLQYGAVKDADAFAAEFDEFLANQRAKDPETRTLAAMALACDTGRPGCSNAFAYGLSGAVAKHISITQPGCDERCRHLADFLAELVFGAVFAGAGAVGSRLGGAVRTRGLCGPNSFASGTPVLMADGTAVPIDGLKIGDKVLATDPATGRTAGKTVTALITDTGDKDLVQLTVDTDGPAGDAVATIATTTHHLLWSPTRGEWVAAGDLTIGDALRDSEGTPLALVARREFALPTTVYNLTVDGLHTYYVIVGTTSVLVHNTGPYACLLGDDGLPVGGHTWGTERPPWTGGKPNSVYTRTGQDGTPVQNTIYDSDGKAVGQFDFKDHGTGGPHGHVIDPPGTPGGGHGPGAPHIPQSELPPGWNLRPGGN
ncbi:polymorphic toxin-type HINT domain-containing protein [Dactylosporangium sp. CA-092794]|uniref:polymorphic toxin-type HINT domain-containing protein n=1 Tax=Dactylosporangium sp. CA-092794 TaxID=3239929 RepID=UPI003D8CC06A